jgi:FAD-linked oxidoreductase
MPEAWTNWSGTESARAVRVVHPTNAAEVAAAVKAAAAEGLPAKAVGTGHSFTPAAVTSGVRLSLDRMASLVSVDGPLARVQGGMTLAALNAALAAHGLALPNLGDIDRQTVAGALATGTHGTGAAYGCLSTFVESLELVTPSGAVLSCSPSSHPDVFAAARVGLGALGVVTEVTLRCVDAFVLEAAERPLPVASVLADLDSYVGDNDHFEFYWFPYTSRVQTLRRNRVPSSTAPLSSFRAWFDDSFMANSVFGGLCHLGRRAPRAVPLLTNVISRGWSARSYTGASYEVFCASRRVRFVEMEYGLPRAALPAAFSALRALISRLPFKIMFPVEVRFTAADDIWLSHGYGRDSAYIAIHQFVGMPYEPYFRGFEQIAAELGGRPHWGKMHYRDAASLRAGYPHFDDFVAVRNRLDPDRVFANPYLDRVLGP